MSDESMVERVARALEASFKAAVAESAETPFEETGVSPPKPIVWQRYARAAIEAVAQHLATEGYPRQDFAPRAALKD